MSYFRYSNASYYRPSFFSGFQFFPRVIKTLLISNVAIFLLATLLADVNVFGTPLSVYIERLLFLYPFGSEKFGIWQLFTYMFMHGNFWPHLVFNMFALWMFGMELENTWGSKKFLLYYLACGVGAGISNLVFGPMIGVAGPTVGASGAIYGVLIAFGMMFPTRPIFVYFLLPVQARFFVAFYILIELYAGIKGTMDGVAHFAHLGGAAVGFVYMMIDQRRLPLHRLWSRARDQFVPRERVNEYSYHTRNVNDAKYYDVRDEEERVSQQQIDEILDKISRHGYQNLSEKEKKILFEASKKLN